MKIKLLTLITILILISGCNRGQQIPDYSLMPKEFKYVINKNTFVCIQEKGVKADEARMIRNIANEIVQYLKHQDYSRIKQYLSPELQTTLESKGIKENKLDTFLPGASQIMSAIPGFQLQSLYLIKTNPESTKISGVCTTPKESNENSLYFNINNPKEDQAGAIFIGRRGQTAAQMSLLLSKINNEWKVTHFSIYPSGAIGNTSFNLYQIASQYKTQGKKNLAYVYYKLLTDISPVETVMPGYIFDSYNALKELNVTLPSKKDPEPTEWEVDTDYVIPVYDLKIMPVNDKIVLHVAYLTETDDVEVNTEESELIKEYIIKNYPDLSTYFNILITEATFEIPVEPDYEKFMKLYDLKQTTRQNVDDNAPE
ncbi:MAG: hypothetical protein AB1782_14655 [Cyanobacteriota bacterium]